MQISKIFLSLTLLFGIFSLDTAHALDETRLYRGVLQIRSYSYDPASGLYILASYGSSVSLGGDRLITNAHVIMDADTGEPYGKYEICRSFLFEKEPKCFSLGKLESYDTDNDLALVKIEKHMDLPKIALASEKRLAIGSPLIIYGYPAIGGSTITRTAGRVAGYDEPFYKIDGIIDRGNSGGGAFSLSGELAGIPSRLITDNASLGYMITVPTIRTFLAHRTPGYTKYTLGGDEDFRLFLTKKYAQKESAYTLKNDIFTATNLKKYGVKFIKNSLTNAKGSQVLLTFLYEKRKMQFILTCGTIAGSRPDFPYWTGGDKSEEEIIKSNRSRYVTIRKYVSKDQYTYVIYDTRTPCIIAPYSPLSPTKDAGVIADLEKFFDEGISLSASFDTTGGFEGSTLSVSSIPKNMMIGEYPDFGGASSTNIYFENSAKKGVTASVGSKTYDRVKDLFSTLFLYSDDIPEDPQIRDIDGVYAKYLTDGALLLSGSIASGDPYYMTYYRDTVDEKGKSFSNVVINIITKDASGKYGIMRIRWPEYDSWLDQSEIDVIRKFVEIISLRSRK